MQKAEKTNSQTTTAMFFLDIEPKENNKEIYEVKYLLHCKITIEAVRQTRQIPQCANCLRLGHTKNFCKRPTRCVKCGGFHNSKTCEVKQRKDLKCALCEQNHPANYRGCKVYKELQQKKFPALRLKTTTPQVQSKTQDTSSIRREGRSFASAVRNEGENNPATQDTSSKQSGDIISKLEKMFEQMFQRMDTMMQIVSKLLDKLN